MAQYFFDTQDGDTDTDRSGVDLAGDQEAIREAARYAGSLIRDQPDIVAQHRVFIVTVRSDTRVVARVRVELEQP